jgi:hypothetical protein
MPAPSPAEGDSSAANLIAAKSIAKQQQQIQDAGMLCTGMLIVPLAHVLGQYMRGSAGLVVFIKMVGCSALALPICWVNRACRQQ